MSASKRAENVSERERKRKLRRRTQERTTVSFVSLVTLVVRSTSQVERRLRLQGSGFRRNIDAVHVIKKSGRLGHCSWFTSARDHDGCNADHAKKAASDGRSFSAVLVDLMSFREGLCFSLLIFALFAR